MNRRSRNLCCRYAASDISGAAGIAAGNRPVSNGDQVSRIAPAMKRGKSVDFTGYWQRHIAD
jgi:hypothetical protein